MNTASVIVAENLTRRFGSLTAVDHLNFEIGRGEIFGFLGHNGAGKTTTVRLLNGILNPNEGRSSVLGLSPLEQGAQLRARTGVLTETPALEERLTAQENLQISAALFGVPKADVTQRIASALKLFDLADRAHEKVAGYSKGMKQRLALARVLLHNPEVVFLDEPTSGLDPIAAHHLHDIMRRLSREENRTIFLCTHNLTEAQQLCDRVGIMEHGRLMALGTPYELVQQLQRNLRIEIEIDPNTSEVAIKELQTFNGIHLSSGTPKHLLILDVLGRELIPDILDKLIRAGVRVYRTDPKDLTLEDVYFILHGESADTGTKQPAEGQAS